MTQLIPEVAPRSRASLEGRTSDSTTAEEQRCGARQKVMLRWERRFQAGGGNLGDSAGEIWVALSETRNNLREI